MVDAAPAKKAKPDWWGTVLVGLLGTVATVAVAVSSCVAQDRLAGNQTKREREARYAQAAEGFFSSLQSLEFEPSEARRAEVVRKGGEMLAVVNDFGAACVQAILHVVASVAGTAPLPEDKLHLLESYQTSITSSGNDKGPCR